MLAALFTAIVVLVPSHARVQATLGAPTAVFPEDFGTIGSVRELPDGRVLVADPLSNALYALDMDAGTRVVIGREGEGPEEYQQPDGVWALPEARLCWSISATADSPPSMRISPLSTQGRSRPVIPAPMVTAHWWWSFREQ